MSSNSFTCSFSLFCMIRSSFSHPLAPPSGGSILLDHLVGAGEQLVWNRDAPPPAGVPSDGASERHQGPALLGGEAIEQPVAAGAAQVGLATAAIGPARGMR